MTAPNDFKGVCLNHVSVGTKPQAVKNFSCISYNWESLECSWVPVKNPIRTEYHIAFSLTKRQSLSMITADRPFRKKISRITIIQEDYIIEGRKTFFVWIAGGLDVSWKLEED
nr:uncharacterized protein LOC106691249 [Halyomorpha halys]